MNINIKNVNIEILFNITVINPVRVAGTNRRKRIRKLPLTKESK